MSRQDNGPDNRRARRHAVSEPVRVIDTMTDQVVGRLGNLSETGMLLVASVPLAEGALYQFRFNLRDGSGHDKAIEVGTQLLWQDTASAPGQVWAGFCFINTRGEQLQHLARWLGTADARSG